MGFKYRYQSMWMKKGFGSFIGAFVAEGLDKKDEKELKNILKEKVNWRTADVG